MANEPNRPPDPEATIMMSSTALKRPEPKPAPNTSANRLVYVVRASGDGWEVVAGEGGGIAQYATRQEAVMAARTDARERWSAHGQPSRVTMEIDGATQMLALYGSDIPYEKPAP
jgi:hypothetical protein